MKAKYYYYNDNIKAYSEGNISIKNRQFRLLVDSQANSYQNFYFDNINMSVNCLKGKEYSKVIVNRVITESEYGKHQKQYLVRLNWLQQQKLLWMFNRQWLQLSGNGIQVIILCLVVISAFAGFLYLSKHS